jgi:hypothetical protein
MRRRSPSVSAVTQQGLSRCEEAPVAVRVQLAGGAADGIKPQRVLLQQRLHVALAAPRQLPAPHLPAQRQESARAASAASRPTGQHAPSCCASGLIAQVHSTAARPAALEHVRAACMHAPTEATNTLKTKHYQHSGTCSGCTTPSPQRQYSSSQHQLTFPDAHAARPDSA